MGSDVNPHKAIDRLPRVQRRNRLQEEIEQEAQIWEKIVENYSSDEAAAHETKAIVRSAAIHLSDDQRRAIELAFFAGLTQQEIAQQLHQPLGTVKARIRRGIDEAAANHRSEALILPPPRRAKTLRRSGAWTKGTPL